MAILPVAAKPALREAMKITQPDGSELTVRLVGDEYAHYMLTSEGLPLVQDERGAYVYAELQADGTAVSTGILAGNATPRSLAMTKLDGVALEKALQTRAAKSEMRASANESAETPQGMARLRGYGRMNSAFPVKGEQKGLVILVEYSDVAFGSKNAKGKDYDSYSDTAHPALAYWHDLLNKKGFDGFGATGSCRDWFIDNSKDAEGNSQFVPEFDVYGPVTLPNTMKFYGGNNSYGQDKAAYDMVVHACQLLDEEIDFSQYDRDGDGKVDNVYIFYAGYGEADYGGDDCVWPHSFDLSKVYKSFKLDGVTIDHYACSNETIKQSRRPDGIGTFVHEFSHVMGLPDLYATDYAQVETPGAYNILDYGPYNNDGLTPPNYSAFERFALGWLDPMTFPEPRQLDLPELSGTNTACYVRTEKPKEYYLFENRQQTGWDKYIPGHGLLIWHVDYKESVFNSNTVNNNAKHQYVDLIKASGTGGLRPREDAYPFPGTRGVTGYEFVSWSGLPCDVILENIAENDGIVSLDVTFPSRTNGIIEVSGVEDDAQAQWYNLQGMPISGPAKGVPSIRVTGAESRIIIM